MSLKRYEPNSDRPWNLQRVWTLHRRAGFGATWEELQRDVAEGPEKTLARVLSGDARIAGMRDDFASMQKILGDSAVTSERSERLIAWWIFQMYFSPDPLRERICIMWHNHFATSNEKVKDLKIMAEQNQIFREMGSEKFKELLSATLKHSAMLKWLDGDQNRVGKPNENLGRETLELFTLGVGNYTESDVKNSSRALTGWTVKEGVFRSRDDWHDAKDKTILGETGDFDGDDLLEIACKHAATSKRLAWRICNEFLSSAATTDSVLDEVAKILAESELNVQLAIETVLQSELFFSDSNLKAKIIGPESFVVGLVRAMEVFDPPASTMVLADWIEQLGRKLFYPPNVGGWPGGKAWLNSRTTIARANFGAALVKGNLKRDGIAPDLMAIAGRHIKSTKMKAVVAFYCELLTGSSDGNQVDEILTKAQQGNPKDEILLKRCVAMIIASTNAQLS